MTNDIRFYFETLAGTECQCGRTKKTKMAFCYKCYSSLPKDMLDDLWQRIGQGFEEAYEKAVGWLN